jgi:hypothetical protein
LFLFDEKLLTTLEDTWRDKILEDTFRFLYVIFTSFFIPYLGRIQQVGTYDKKREFWRIRITVFDNIRPGFTIRSKRLTIVDRLIFSVSRQVILNADCAQPALARSMQNFERYTSYREEDTLCTWLNLVPSVFSNLLYLMTGEGRSAQPTNSRKRLASRKRCDATNGKLFELEILLRDLLRLLYYEEFSEIITNYM